MFYLSPYYNMTDLSYVHFIHNREIVRCVYSDEEINDTLQHGNIHYNGHKPWKGYCVNFDIWWEYYRKSPFFNENFYFDFFYEKLNMFDHLSLLKRIKILIRYFM